MRDKAALFDMDGVLVLTNHLKERSHVTTVHKFGGKAGFGLYRQVIGQSHESVRSAFIQASGVAIEPAEYTQTYRRIYKDLLQTQLEIATGIPTLLSRLSDQGFLLAVVSSSNTEAANMILAKTGLGVYFAVRVTSDDVSRKKPAPDAYLLALEGLGVKAENAVVCEDTSAGIAAASAAGLPVIAIRHSLNVDQDFSEADYVVDSFGDTEAVLQMITGLLD
jgi:HAD superfamily hydrolase (TIGR01509 family)